MTHDLMNTFFETNSLSFWKQELLFIHLNIWSGFGVIRCVGFLFFSDERQETIAQGSSGAVALIKHIASGRILI
jgi:hypothetical protein